MLTARQLIDLLGLVPLPGEGGFYRETYRSGDCLAASALPGRYTTPKVAATAIYYLLTKETFSALHRLPTDEVFHLYMGGPVRMLQLLPDGSGRLVILGTHLEAGQSPQVVVPRGAWQGSLLAEEAPFALLGTTMAPGFDFADYEAGERTVLCTQYPAHAELIRQLTRQT